MENLFGDIQQLIQHNPWLAVVAVFVGGIVTASNPCVLAMVPLMISFVAGKKGTISLKKHSFFHFNLSWVWPLRLQYWDLSPP